MRLVTPALVQPTFCQPAMEDRENRGFGSGYRVPCLEDGRRCWRTAEFLFGVVRLPAAGETLICARGLGTLAVSDENDDLP